MNNPVIISCPAEEWVRVARNVLSGSVSISNTSPNVYLQTYRMKNNPPPLDKTDGIPLYTKKIQISATDGIDVYIMAVAVPGEVIVENGFIEPGLSFAPDEDWKDTISDQDIIVDLLAGRFNDVSGLEIGLNEKNTDPDGSLNLGPDAYEQLIKKSEDISDGVWVKLQDATVANLNDISFAITNNSRVTQLFVSTDTDITVSLLCDIADVGKIIRFGIWDDVLLGLSTGRTGNITIIESPEGGYGLAQYTWTGLSNPDQIALFNGSANIVQTINDCMIQVTPSTYRLPYAPNDSAVSTLLVPSNNSGPASGYSYEIKENLRNSLDGVADGVEKVTDIEFSAVCGVNWTCGTGWVIGSGLATYTSGTAASLTQDLDLTTGFYYETEYEILSNTGVVLKGGGANFFSIGSDIESSVGTHVVRSIAANDSGIEFRYSSGSGVIVLGKISTKQISDAQGELVKTIIPMFNAGDIGAIVNIATANDEETSFFLYDDINELLTAFDGTNTATVAFSPVLGVEYEIRLMYGDNSGQKMKVAVDLVWGNEVANVGIFPNDPDKDLRFGYNSAWFKMKIDPGPKWYEDVKSSW